jgi:hypothetical protein
MNEISAPDDVQREAERLWKESRTPWGRFQHGVDRFFSRTMRIVWGAVVAYLPYYWWADKLHYLTHKPLTTLTLADIGAVLWRIAAALLVVIIACYMAFGKSSPRNSPADFRFKAQQIVAANNRRNARRERLRRLPKEVKGLFRI